ncbi:MAG: prephenate dehydrogenase/arogenate dehydrogenase family protein [Clostridia bacterium]|nr:prephenate dehydrogenase/arogenate dehydrogenase family protein [Clostridia bacterium]
MKVGVIGLGLIGGSMAKAYKRDPEMQVYGADSNRMIVDFAILAQAIDGELTDDILPEIDLLFLASYPQGVIDHLKRVAPLLSEKCTVIDLSGIKQKICEVGFPLAEKYGFCFIGGHPMAGTHKSGFKYSQEDMFDGQPMVIVPPVFDDILLLDRIKKLLKPARFGRISAITAEEHDRRIAFTSQMAHVVSNAFIKSPTARAHDGFSAGSYRDLTRVAWLNPDMWAELFLENREALLFELDTLISSLSQYRSAINDNDLPSLRSLLDEGRRIKEEVDG